MSDGITGMVNRQPAWIMYNPIIDWRNGMWSLLVQSVIEVIVMSLMACAILSCCRLIRPIMSLTIFIQFLFIGIILGLNLVNILYFSDLFRGLSSVIFVCAILVQTFPFCYYCDLLSSDCTDLANLLAQSNWFDASIKYKSTLRIFLLHAQQPIEFIAGGVFPISLKSNVQMAKFAFSVMTIVQRMNLTNRFK
ncbi:odorant receptor 59b-like [Drosophila mojavensis]|uniref:odorant receptor 59b-like n=1 Tax=Drosophila mojavensis TaxID=7230 RepID=UPI001CD176AA|nr:odorant receptor 59b-like [Drosophila mojavensis]